MKRGISSLFIGLLISVLTVVIPGPNGILLAAGQELSTQAINNFEAQVSVLAKEKVSMTEVQKKIDSQIFRYLRSQIKGEQLQTLPKLQNTIVLNSSNEILIDIKANVSESLLTLITAKGGTIINKFPQYHAIRALIPITAVEDIAAHADVQFIKPAELYETRKTNISEGVAAHNVPPVRDKGYTGSGIKVGVLSDSVDYLSQVQATGDLPSVTVLQDSPGNSGEGTAMLEIVYDMAPEASLYFATANGGMANFANNIIALKNTGCKVIVDDVGYFAESPFQDDVISQAVSEVTAAGAFYFSSAANSGNLLAGTSGTWEGNYLDDGSANHYHLFATGIKFNKITKNPPIITLFWSDPLGYSANDYDLYVVDIYGNVIAYSAAWQTGTQDPYEQIIVGIYGYNYLNYYVAIVKYDGAGRFLHLGMNRGTLQYATAGETHGHQTVESAFCISAVSAYHRTSPFTGSESLETFTSDGPRRIFYYADGTAITPGNYSATGGKVRNKPDITAADGVACATPGFNPFYGTSAAAPHAAAIAACLLSNKTALTEARLKKALTKTALPLPTFWNNVAGYGIVMADRTLTFLNPKISGLPLLLLD